MALWGTERAFKLMLKVFVGDDRVAAGKAVESELGGNYEVFEGDKIEITDLPSIFRGVGLFSGEKRQILLKEVGENAAVWEKLADYVDTEHEVVVWEGKIDKRSAGYKRLKETGVEIREFALKVKPEMRQVFNIFEVALRDGSAAVKMVEKIELEQDPFMFFGLMVTQALKMYGIRMRKKEKMVLQELSKLDMQMKGEGATTIEPWVLIKSFLLRLEKIGE